MSNEPENRDPQRPAFGFILLGGGLSGALVRDIRLANELADRGYPVHVWWAMDRQKISPLRNAITQHDLFNGMRYYRAGGSALWESVGKLMTWWWPDRKRARSIQKRRELLERLMGNMVRLVCAGVERDARVMKRFIEQVEQSGVKHLLPMLGVLAPWAEAARKKLGGKIKYVVTFQGYELYVHYARVVGIEKELYEVLQRTAAEADYPSIAVSEDYVERVVEDIGVPREGLRAIPPGVPVQGAMPRERAIEIVKKRFKGYVEGVPLITYLGRQDTEKGIDLFLYATAILRRKGIRMQVVVAGPTLFGNSYSRAIRQIAEELRGEVMFAEDVADEVREALYSVSRAVVYPSIHREPFGMVPVEAEACGTPAIVPNYGGVTQTIEAEGRTGGLRFNAWDSGDLAAQMRRIIEDEKLYETLKANGPGVADYFSVARLADRVLKHLGIQEGPEYKPQK